MRAVILAGGSGTRMREETEFRPKPMVEIGGRPVLLHIMDNLARQGITDFVLLVGYKASLIKEYFLHLDAYTHDFTISLGKNETLKIIGNHTRDWSVTVLDTGLDAETGLRLASAQKIVGSERFFCTYGDGLASVSIDKLLQSHARAGAVGTMTVTQPSNRFGVVKIGDNLKVQEFREKPKMSDFINIGHFVFEPEVFDTLGENESLESGLLRALVARNELNAYKHYGFWEPMDTYREYLLLNSLWESGEKPWVYDGG